MDVHNTSFPLEIKDVNAADEAELLKYFTGQRSGFIRVGPKGYLLPKKYREEAAKVYNMVVRPSDIYIATYPRSGTTWTQELIWLVANDCDYEAAAATTLIERFPYLEFSSIADNHIIERMTQESNGDPKALEMLEMFRMSSVEMVASMPSPRFIKSHLPLSLLPPALLDTAKVVYVARDPRDAAVSFYHHNRLIKLLGYVGDFKKYWDFFLRDLILYAPFFAMTKEAWEQKDHPNLLFLFYEDLLKDLPSGVRRVATFLGKHLTEQQVERLCDHLNIDNFRKNKSVNIELEGGLISNENEQKFIRKGKMGGWRDYFDEEMTAQAQSWIEENLRDSDLRFPE